MSDDTQMKVVKVVMDHPEADVIAGFLRANGIDTMVVTDDAGETIPSLDESEGIQIVVREEDAAEAERLLAERERSDSEEE